MKAARTMQAQRRELLFRLAGLSAIALLMNARPARGAESDCITVENPTCTACNIDNEPGCVFVFCEEGGPPPFIVCF
jgi:hypothetical protein